MNLWSGIMDYGFKFTWRFKNLHLTLVSKVFSHFNVKIWTFGSVAFTKNELPYLATTYTNKAQVALCKIIKNYTMSIYECQSYEMILMMESNHSSYFVPFQYIMQGMPICGFKMF